MPVEARCDTPPSMSVTAGTSLSLSSHSLSLYLNASEKVQIVSGSGEYEITSMNPAVASAHLVTTGTSGGGRDGGSSSTTSFFVEVTALSAGATTVSVEDRTSGQTAEIAVTALPFSSFAFGTRVLMTGEGETVSLAYTCAPEGADASGLAWTTSDETVASVSGTGTVTAHSAGSCKVAATCGGMTLDECVVCVGDADGTSDGHDYIDLGLPSGTLWAATNIGADSPGGSGSYFQWGETAAQDDNEANSVWTDYAFCDGTAATLTRYCSDGGSWAGEGSPDNMTELADSDDAAYATWGHYWRVPSASQFEELVDAENTTTLATSLDGVDGILVTSLSNGRSIFLPAASRYSDGTLDVTPSAGWYWSRTLGGSSQEALSLAFTSAGVESGIGVARCSALTIRPVYEGIRPTTDISVSETDLDFGSVAMGSSRTLTVDIRNNTFVPQEILTLSLDDPEFSLSWSGGGLAPKSTQRVAVTYAPASARVAAGGSLVVGTSKESSLVNVSASSHKGSSALTTRENLVVWCNDGSRTSFVLNDRPKVTIGDGVLRVVSGAASAEYSFSDVLKLTYEGVIEDAVPTGIDDKPAISRTEEALVFTSDSGDLHVQIVNASGMTVRKFLARRGTVSTVPFSQLTPGVYIVRVNKFSYKIAIR